MLGGWTIEDCHNTHIKHHIEFIPLTDFAGKTLDYVKQVFGRKRLAAYRMQPDILIRNDRFINLTPKSDFPSLKVNGRGWVGQCDGIDDNYIIQEGDEGFFNVWQYFHRECNRKYLAKNERVYFTEILSQAGFDAFRLLETKNHYCECEVCAPWYRAQTPFGEILIGWRKRVIHVDWSKTGKDLLHLFKDEDVTKDKYYIHAWGKEKAIEYLNRIRESIAANP